MCRSAVQLRTVGSVCFSNCISVPFITKRVNTAGIGTWTAFGGPLRENWNPCIRIIYLCNKGKQWQIRETTAGGYVFYAAANTGLKMMSTAYGTNPMRLSSLAKQYWPYRCDAMDDKLEISSGTSYTSNGMYVSSVTDSRGYTTSYTYNENTGKLTKKVDAKGNVYQTYYTGTEATFTFLDADKDGVAEDVNPSVMYIHPNNRLTEISAKGATYLFGYQANGNMSSVKVGVRTLAEYTYGNGGRGLPERMDYGNGDYFTYTYDALGRVEKVEYVNGTARHHYLYSYDNAGNVTGVYDSQRDVTVRTYYDSEGNVYGWSSSDGKSFRQGVDEKDRVVLARYKWGNEEKSYRYTYSEKLGKENRIASVTLPNGATAESKRDGFDRVTGTEIRQGTDVLTNRITYLAGSGKNTTALIKKLQCLDGTVLTYYYDQLGNITSVQWPDEDEFDSEIYQYDDLSQLVRADRHDLGTTVTYRYNTAGNIQEKKTYAWTADPINESTTPVKTVTYTYGDNWRDLLTAYDGEQITYDNIGNPLSYYNGMEFEWSNGRQLTSVQIDENTTLALKYDENGMRSSKTKESLAGGVTLKEEYSYYYASGSLMGMRYRNWYAGYDGESWAIWFLYDEKGEMIGLTNGAETYYYVKNAQGDVLALIDIEGNVAAKYQYDPWGKVISVKKPDGTDLTGSGHIGNLNPIRYRGYVYDNETGLYYVSSRYYDPEVGRWINADGYVSTGQGVLGNNMFAYCGNNPVNRVDHTGQFWSEIWEFAKTAVAEIGKAIGAMSPAYAGCGGAAVADGPLPFGDIVAAAGAALLTVGAIGYGIYQAAKAPSISIPKADTKEKAITAPPPSNGTTYYHVTTPDNAATIMATGIMTGSKWESGYVYAWSTNPSKYAIENSGAHMGVTISFKTSASFVMDTGIKNPKVQIYGPVVSTIPGPIVVWDVQIVGYKK